ncbi:glycosyltransferase [Acinetobacter towneri]|uniref:glycosyltransferase n=1 Tax=Acinetobacter towneri TaxID=202956 RepID=UPI002DBD5BB0|nr:glycosyltransferase [Acinetobacter towneri]MEB6564908.1 glycosyltransferase [Acinetobacter towneri]
MKNKLLIIIPHIGAAGGGVSESARLLADALYKRDIFEIHILSINTEDDLNVRQLWPNVQFHFYESFGPANFGFSPGMVGHILKNKYDIIHVHGVWTFHVFVAAIGGLKNIPIVISPHGMLEPWILKRSPHLKSMVSKLYQNKVFDMTSIFHALTSKEEEDIKNLLPKAKIETIPNFVPKFNFTNPDYPSWFKDEFKGKKIFLFFGRIHDKKGWKPLLEAWLKFCQKNNIAKNSSILVFCGWIDGIPDFEDKIREVSDITGNIIYAGAQYGLDRIKSYNIADFFILPSKSEGLPMAVLEAVNSSTVVMMSHACNLSGLINSCAAINTGTDEDTILASLEYAYLLDNESIKNLKTRAEVYVDNNYSEDKVVNSMINLFNKVISLKK